MKAKSESGIQRRLGFTTLPLICAGVFFGGLALGGQAPNYTVLYNFAGADGSAPQGALLVSDGILYGTTAFGGISNAGTVFRLSTDGAGFSLLKSFTGRDVSLNDGMSPRAKLVLAGATLYGTTVGMPFIGTTNLSHGSIFSLANDGSTFTLLTNFISRANPWGGLVLSGATLYGTTRFGGDADAGIVFAMQADGSGFTLLHSFSQLTPNGSNSINADGAQPFAGLLLSSQTLYGAAYLGGAVGYGTVFKLNTDGSGFAVLKNFTGPDGANPRAGLVLSGTTLYGTTSSGGVSNLGTVFKLNTDGSGYAVLKDFTGPDGAYPYAGPVVSGTTLFGTTQTGGSLNLGTVFMLNIDGGDFTVAHDFSGPEGATPYAGLAVSGLNLYGGTSAGGNANHGVVFRLAVAAPTVIRPPQTQTAEVGASVDFSVGANGSVPLFYEWYFNDTNLISSGTNCGLQLTGVQFSQAGAYTAVVTNVLGTATSAPALLNVVAAVPRRTVVDLNLAGEVRSPLNLEYSDSLSSAPDWLPLDTISLTSSPQLYFDVTMPLPPQRFYRVSQTDTPFPPQVLNLGFAQALTLTGSLGDSLRVDCINQFGPTNGWWTLDAVTLTNESQLYFDTSVIKAVQRLYRIVPVP
jgi:uncharacterized repeat protein (TIGR03803 family)